MCLFFYKVLQENVLTKVGGYLLFCNVLILPWPVTLLSDDLLIADACEKSVVFIFFEFEDTTQ
jgi:hypothetical protein